MKNKVIVINGPNLNLLGEREKEKYGNFSLADIEASCLKYANENNLNATFFQSNIEGELINKLQEASTYDYIILNAGGYTHTSVAIADCVEAIKVPIIEVHISNIYSRDEFRRKSLISLYCLGCIVGFGLNSYKLALEHIISK